MSFDRNAKCWCGSGKKYKKCHLEFDEKIESHKIKGDLVPDRSIIKSASDIEGIKKSAAVNNAVLDLVASKIKAGMRTACLLYTSDAADDSLRMIIQCHRELFQRL